MRNFFFLAVFLILTNGSAVSASPFFPVCERIAEVQSAILRYLPPTSAGHTSDCHSVTESDLAQIENFGAVQLPLGGNAPLRTSDLQGLTQLSALSLGFPSPFASVPKESFARALSISNHLFLETPHLKSLVIRYSGSVSSYQTLSGPLQFSAQSFEGLSELKHLTIRASSVDLNRAVLAPLTSLESLALLDLTVVPDELSQKVGETPVRFAPSELSASGIFSGLPSLKELVVAKRSKKENSNFDASSDHFKFVPIKPGKFMMGSPTSDGFRRPEEEKQHLVTLTKPFEMQTTEVTQSLWEKVMGHRTFLWPGSELPATHISVPEITGPNGFLPKLNQLKHGQGFHYRLPTEAEWEYAARANTTAPYFFGEDADRLGEFGWFYFNSQDRPHPVARLKPNPFGLYDMLGNAWEWVQDSYEPYSATDQKDPLVVSESSHAIRGGGWSHYAETCRCASRSSYPNPSGADIGFRLVRTRD